MDNDEINTCCLCGEEMDEDGALCRGCEAWDNGEEVNDLDD